MASQSIVFPVPPSPAKDPAAVDPGPPTHGKVLDLDAVRDMIPDFDHVRDVLWRNWGPAAQPEPNGQKQGVDPGTIAPSGQGHGAAGSDGGGKSDVLWHNDEVPMPIHQMDGGQSAQGVHPGGIGANDLLWQQVDGQTTISQMSGGEIKQTFDFGVVDTGWHVAAIGDFDIGGTSDILWYQGNGQATLWEIDDGHIKQAYDFGIRWYIENEHSLF